MPFLNSPLSRRTVLWMLLGFAKLEGLENEVSTCCHLQRYANFWRFLSRAVIFEVWWTSAVLCINARRALPQLPWPRGDWVAWIKAPLGPVESPFRTRLNFAKGGESLETFIALTAFQLSPSYSVMKLVTFELFRFRRRATSPICYFHTQKSGALSYSSFLKLPVSFNNFREKRVPLK